MNPCDLLCLLIFMTLLSGSQTSPAPPDTSAGAPQKQESSIGVGVVIGVCIMLVVDGVLLYVAYLFRDEIADCIGVKKARNTNVPVMSNIQSPQSTVIAPAEIQRQGGGDEYEVPVDRNDYEALQRAAADVPNTYEKIRTYQNV
ncbi:uncharacterized protein LOC124256787 [Haliotis rubra]|uniref:uncharacterized protein LOC124256787 n=1 Tax=Haliotis rubra TaxID=36100 RepID=UPI001EE60BB9|nr:uncharacterized protein LOC124256787 [Haliotis rubra]